MFYPTVFTSCLFAVINLLILARPVQGSKPLRHDIIARAAAKGTHALSQRNKGDLITRQDYNSWAEGDPAYLADVVSWACDTVSEDLHDTCVEEVFVHPPVKNCYEDLLTLAQDRLHPGLNIWLLHKYRG